MNELLNIFEGKVELSDELKTALSALWEAKVEAVTTELEAKQEKYITEEVIPFYEQKAQNYIDDVIMPEVNDYVTESVKDFARKHEKELRNYAITEANSYFIGKMKDLFEGMSIKVPEGKVNELSDAMARIAKLEEQVESATQAKIIAEKAVLDMKKGIIVEDLKDGMSELQAEKFSKLIESIDSDSLETFEKRANLIKESVTVKAPAKVEEGKDTPPASVINEDGITDPWLRSLVDSVKKNPKA